MQPDDPHHVTPPDAGRPKGQHDEPVTVGTLFIMILFLMALGGMWLIMYFQLLGR